MGRKLPFFAATVLVAALNMAVWLSAQTATPPAPDRWVTDTAGLMSAAAANRLNARLQGYEEQTGHQLLVWIGTTTGAAPIEDFAVRAFEQWGVGRRGMDDGIVLFIMTEDRRLRFEVGYGLEGDVPDAVASRIINEIIVPRIQANDPDGAVTAGMEAVAAAIGGPPLPDTAPGATAPLPGAGRPITIGELIIYAILGIAFLILLATNPSLAIYLLASMMSGGRGRGHRGGFGGGRGGFGGGGGWRGGGGRSGGGGASGSW